MGSGTSRAADPRLDTLPAIEKRGEVALVSVLPEDEALKKKDEVLLLEVGPEGLRLLRPGMEVPVGGWKWPQIHSWESSRAYFSFKFYEENKRAVTQYRMGVRDVTELKEHIDGVIQAILSSRKKQQISTEAFDKLLARVQAAQDGATQLDLLRDSNSFFSSQQGKKVLETLPTAFDKIEAAAVLHSKLIDQNCFSLMLHALDSPGDRDNVWFRITQMKREAAKA